MIIVGPLLEHHSPQARIAVLEWVRKWPHEGLGEVAARHRRESIHQLEARLEGVAAAVVEALAGIDEQHRSLGVGKLDGLPAVHDSIHLLVGDPVGTAALLIAQRLPSAAGYGRRQEGPRAA